MASTAQSRDELLPDYEAELRLPLGDLESVDDQLVETSNELVTLMGAHLFFDEVDEDEDTSTSPAHLDVERGCRDRDPVSQDPALSPIIRFGTYPEGAVDFKWPSGHEHWDRGAQNSPRRLAKANDLISHAARAAYRLQTFSAKGAQPQHGTGGPVAPRSFGSAGHMLSTKAGTPQTRFRATNRCPVFEGTFENKSVPRAHLKCPSKDVTIPGAGLNTDPVTNRTHTELGNLVTEDVTFWELTDERTGFDDRGVPPVVHAFDPFWLPLSLQAEQLLLTPSPQNPAPNKPACGMASYPCVDGLREWLSSNQDADRDLLVKTYASSVGPEVARLKAAFKSKHSLSNDDAVKAHPQYAMLVLQVEKHIRSLLDRTWQGVSDGDPVISLGRILAGNETMLAHSMTTHNGSSGGLMFVLEASELPLMYCGIHSGPAPKRLKGVDDGHPVFPDHNVATSTDNVGHVVKYVRDVLPRVPGPQSAHWSGTLTLNEGIQQRRKRAFTRWLVSNFWKILRYRDIIENGSAVWSLERLPWLLEAWATFEVMKGMQQFVPTVSKAAMDLVKMLAIIDQLKRGFEFCKKEAVHNSEMSQIFNVAPPVTWQTIEAGLELPTVSLALAGQLGAIVARGISEGVDLTAWNAPPGVRAKSIDMLFIIAEALADAGFQP